MKMLEKDFLGLLPECCRLGVASLAEYQDSEKEQILALLPTTQSVIVIAHHVQDSLEWTWLKFSSSRVGVTSPADIHCLAMAERIANRLQNNHFQTLIVPYPGVSGPLFKRLAEPTGLGRLGDNFLLMNADWGPWMQLRVVLTDAPVEHAICHPQDACTHCGRCIEACPADAFRNGTFDGLNCRDKMREMAKTKCDGSFDFECELCLRACPVGTQPKAITVRFSEDGK